MPPPSLSLPACSRDLKRLNGFLRAQAHAYCDEIGIGHDSLGTDPNRFIRLTRPGDEAEAAAGREETREELEARMEVELSKELRAVSDKRVEGQEDVVAVGTAGWKQRYYDHKFGAGFERDKVKQAYGPHLPARTHARMHASAHMHAYTHVAQITHTCVHVRIHDTHH